MTTQRTKWILILTLLNVWMLVAALPSVAQTNLDSKIEMAIKTGSTNELSLHLDDAVELKLDGKEGIFSKRQAEFALKEFFGSHPPKSFQYIHKGESRKGYKYAIGTFVSEDGGKYRVYMKMKSKTVDSTEIWKIDTLDFTKE